MSRYPLPACLCLVLALAAGVAGQGRIIVPPDRRPVPPHIVPRPPRPQVLPIELRAGRIEATVEDRVAVTRVSQTFYNPNPMALEGEYVFPLPPGATVGKFALAAGGKEMAGEVLAREQARGIYEDIVRRQRDPALLEYLDWGLFKARVFPIPPRGEVVLALRFESVLESDAGMTLVRYPFARPDATPDGGGELVIQVQVETRQSLKAVYSPSHPVDVVRRGASAATVSFEGDCRTGRDFLLYLTTDDRPFGLHVLTHKKPGEPGFFLAMIAPKAQFDPAEIEPKDILLVLDTSGSMKGEKIQQAREAARFCLQSLDRRDRFNMICFSTDAREFRDALLPATPDNVKAALAFLDTQEALGGTNIHQALLKATASLDAEDRLGITLFLTDGIPTVDVIDTSQILKAVQKSNRARNRIFVFGVGSDVNTRLLDLMAEQNRGTRTYVGAGESIEVKVSAFYEKVRYPVLADLKLKVAGQTVFDTYPRELPDLFKGSQLLVLGRYAEAGRHAITLRGRMKNAEQTFTYEADFPADRSTGAFIPRLWAMRKVGFLLDQVRLHGAEKELTDAIVALGKRYGIVTPYTSFLVIEDERALVTRLQRGGGPGQESPDLDGAVRALRDREERAENEAQSTLRRESGDEATRVSRASGKLRAGEAPSHAAPAPAGRGGSGRAAGAEADDFASLYFGRFGSRVLDDATREELRRIGYGFKVVEDRTFVYLGGVWVDTLFDPKTMRESLVQVEAFSEPYFALVRKHPALGKFFTVGPRCLVVVDAKAFQIVEQEPRGTPEEKPEK
ncbi:MAG: VWA domain-containing protein [Planctomycetes bacterium]|nr:VWA domain-containing protein [Planctomycetota bacterium]